MMDVIQIEKKKGNHLNTIFGWFSAYVNPLCEVYGKH
jgi:hypothetical protein